MRSARIAEWILALFLEPDRAAAYTGDLMEESAEHGAIWFWSSVARLAIMRFWYDISESPLFLAGVLLRACVQNIVVSFFILALGIILLLVPVLLLTVSLHFLFGLPLSVMIGKVGLFASIGGIAGIALGGFYTGRWIAVRMPGREMVACIAMCVARPLLYALVAFAVTRFRGSIVEHHLLSHPTTDQTVNPGLPDSLISLMTYAGVLAGGLRNRLRRAAQ